MPKVIFEMSATADGYIAGPDGSFDWGRPDDEIHQFHNDQVRGLARRMIELFCLVLGTGLVAYFAWYAVQMTYDSYRFNDMSQGVLGIPLWIPQLGYSVGLVILAIAFADDLIQVVSGRPPSYEKPPAATPDEVVERAMESGI